MNQVKMDFPGARHYVYAFRLLEGGLEKYSDDGEPQGTGGRPILESLQHREIWNVLLVVVRYFGGILLGTGGLSRAYGGTARLVIEKARIDFMTRYTVYKLKLSYAWYEKLKYQFQIHSWFVLEENFSEFININVAIPIDESEQFCRWLEEFCAGQVHSEFRDTIWKAAIKDK